jgi:hypothetical protein
MRIHPVFHISLLEKADANTPLDETTTLGEEVQVPEYEAEEILDHGTTGRQHKYLIKWKGYSHDEDT